MKMSKNLPCEVLLVIVCKYVCKKAAWKQMLMFEYHTAKDRTLLAKRPYQLCSSRVSINTTDLGISARGMKALMR